MKSLPKKLQIYLITLYIVTPFAVYLLIASNYVGYILVDGRSILFFVVFTALTETFTVVFKGISFSTTTAVTVAAYILFGPLTAILITLLGFSIRVLKTEEKFINIFNTPIYKTAFNFCVLILTIICGNYAYFLLGGTFPVNDILNNLIPITGFIAAFYLSNVLLIAILVSILSDKNVVYCFLGQMRLFSLSTLIMSPFGIILSFIYNQYGYIGVLLFVFPIVLSRYTFSLYIESKYTYVQTVDALMRAVEARDKYTEGHSQRVAQLSESIARELKYSESKIEQLNIAALLHDVGKIGIDDNILNKPGKLTDEEYSIIKGHPEIGYNILKSIRGFKNILNIVRHHHERYDGKGYPYGKRYDEMRLDVFIVQLADSIDAMTTDRPYRKALTSEQVIHEIKTNRETQFHPEVVDAYLRILKKSV